MGPDGGMGCVSISGGAGGLCDGRRKRRRRVGGCLGIDVLDDLFGHEWMWKRVLSDIIDDDCDDPFGGIRIRWVSYTAAYKFWSLLPRSHMPCISSLAHSFTVRSRPQDAMNLASSVTSAASTVPS